MPQEYSQHQLERMVMGREENPNVIFYEQSKMNPDLSREAGRRVYQTRLMIKKTQPGLPDFAAYVAQPSDIKEWPDEYQYFLNTQGDAGSPPIDIIPGIPMDIIQELRDMHITTITRLVNANTLPAHLQPAQASARRLNEVLKHEQENNSIQAEEVPAADRPDDPVDLGRPELSRGLGPEVGPTTEGVRQGGRLDSGEGRTGTEAEGHRPGRQEEEKVDYTSPNWSISFG